MLVAFQRTGELRRLPAAAEHLVELLRSWGRGPAHLTGLALTGITVPSRLGPRAVDALVFTRSGVVVIAAHSPGPWLSPGPGERAGAGVAAAKGALAAHDGGRYVTGLVAVVPPVPGSEWADVPELPEPRDPVAESRLYEGAGETDGYEPVRSGPEPSWGEHVPVEPEADQAWHEPGRDWREADSAWSEHVPVEPEPDQAWPEPAPPWYEADSFPGVAVVLADPRGLRRIIGQHNRWRTVWSADDVLDACYALSLAHLAPPRSALLADGFPARLPTLARLPELPAVVSVPPDPPVPAADDDPGPLGPRSRGPADFPRPRPIRQVPWGLVFVLTLLVTVGVIAAVFVAQVFHGS
ncbi:hypothetical protein AB0C38_33935 [Amycolatopsis sp. NPDC048633]|uniref:hypothetical protein n=1 Tax=Amycolatopsis sp. NPDC048633 TaxID=3157095 RepID=UPI0033F04C20